MGPLVKGDVVVFPFPYTDLLETKRRPALVVHPLNGTDTMLCMITHTDHADGWSVPLIEKDFQSGSLNGSAGSFIRVNRIFVSETKKITARAGRINDPKLEEVVGALVELVTEKPA